MSKEHKDLFGREIKPGDYIVYAAVDGRSGTLRVGQVIELKPDGRIFTKSWSNFEHRGPDRSGRQKNVTLSFMDRLIVVPVDLLSDKVWQDLRNPAYNWDGTPIKNT